MDYMVAMMFESSYKMDYVWVYNSTMLKFNLTEDKTDSYEAQLSPGNNHEWIYRGQITPQNKKITIHAHIKSLNKDFSVVADGALTVDGICIYEMKNFGMMLIKKSINSKIYRKSQISEKLEKGL